MLNSITDLEEDVILYGICSPKFGFSERGGSLVRLKRAELLRLVKYTHIILRTPVRMSWVTENCKITKKNQISGVISSLSKKGIVKKCGKDFFGEETIALTEKGVEVLKNI